MSLDLFHPLIREWFSAVLGEPTEIQQKAWPEIAAGRHVLVTAPTGSGKTLTAFLWAIHRLIEGSWPCGALRVLYVSPLKALNNDVQRNLMRPLAGLREHFERSGAAFPHLRVLTRSGDTPGGERRRMAAHPPEILITTPESLNILLGSKNTRRIFRGLASVVLDEIHAVAGSKRGTHLITAVDRLVPLAGDFQRIALSATVRPRRRIADFVGGFTMEGDPLEPVYRRREVAVIDAGGPRKIEVSVRFPEDARERLENDSWWPALADAFRSIASAHRSTLFFAESRRLAEKVTRLINEGGGPEPLAYAHHGSLSRELRLAVEQRLKRGELRAIVATHSLELGIDVGALDQVVLIQTPRTVASAVQRIGRSGHGVGRTSRGVLFPIHGRDFLDAAVMARCVAEDDIEPIRPPEAPLDVLAQMLLSMTVVEKWNVDALFAFVRSSHPYRGLSRAGFDRVLDMLAGRYGRTRIRDLRARVIVDRLDRSVQSRPGTAMVLHLAGGTIPDRGYYRLRLEEGGGPIGELDEEFVWERSVGDTFALGTRTWRIRKISHSDVTVSPAEGGPGLFPFWRAEARNRDFHFSERIGRFLEDAEGAFQRGEDLVGGLQRSCFMDEPSARELAGFLGRQREATGCALPHRHHLLVEHLRDSAGPAGTRQVILHTLWGGRINRPYAIAVAEACCEADGYAPEIFADDDAVAVMLPEDFEAGHLLDRVRPENLERLLRRRLDRTGFFGARFRENAGRSLLLPRTNRHRRTPLWLNRLRARKLMEAVSELPEFPVVLETWRTCLQDDFDLPRLAGLLDEIADGTIALSSCRTAAASPFARGFVWQQINQHMYEDDTPSPGTAPGLTDALYRELTASSALRPRISRGWPGRSSASCTGPRRDTPHRAPRNCWIGRGSGCWSRCRNGGS